MPKSAQPAQQPKASVSLIVHSHGKGDDDAVHTFKASHVTQVFDYVDRLLQLPPASYELLCGGLLLRRDPLAKLAVPYPGAPLRIELIRYQDPSLLPSPSSPPCDSGHEQGDLALCSVTDADDDDKVEDECAQFTAAHADPSSLTDKEHMLLTLVEMFEDLPTDILVHATLTANALDDAIETALTLQALAASEHHDSDSVTAPPPSSSSSSAATASSSIDTDLFSKYLTEPLAPPPAPPFSPSPTSKSSPAAKRKKKKKAAATGTLAALGPPGVSTLTSPDMQLLLDMFPKHHASQLEVALHLHNGNVESAATYLLGVPANRAFKCDGACGDLGFPCLVHGTAWRDPKASETHKAHTWNVEPTAPRRDDDKVQALMHVFTNRPMWEVKAALDKMDGDVARASSVLAGDKLGAKTEAPANPRPKSTEARKPSTSDALSAKPATAHDNPFAVLLQPKRPARSTSGGFTRVTHHHHKRTGAHVQTFHASKRDHRTPHAQAADHLVLPSLPNPSYPTPLTTDDLYLQRAHRFAMARAALHRHAGYGGQVAGALAEAGHDLTAEIRAREHAAAWAHVAPQVDRAARHARHAWTVDLHGLTAPQAAQVVPQVVRAWWAAEHVTHDALDVRAKRHLTLVVGVGNHSKPGHVRLGPTVVKVLGGLGCRFVDESKARGQVIVTGLMAGAVVR